MSSSKYQNTSSLKVISSFDVFTIKLELRFVFRQRNESISGFFKICFCLLCSLLFIVARRVG